jgi:hypothetical protein
VDMLYRTLPLLVVLVSACSPEQARHTVEEYRADAELRHAQVARCHSDPGTLKKTPDCINAQQASALEDRLRLRDMPAIGLDKSRETSASQSGTEVEPTDGQR